MKSIRNIARTTAAALFVALGGWSCTTEEQIAVDPMPEGMETIDLSITVPPGAPENTATRALSADGEKTVAEVDVLQFTGDKFAHRAIGYGIEVTGDKTRSFTAKLLTGTSDDLVLIVNGRAQVNDAMNGTNGVEKITAATTLQEALDRLKIEVTATNKITTDVLPALPMFGFVEEVSVQAGSTIAAQLVRSLAKVTLSREAAVTDAIFKFADVRLYNQALEGWIAPKFSSWNTADNVATAPWFGPATAPDKASYTATPSDAPILYTGSADEVTNAGTDYSIYTFEAPAGSEAGKESNVCLVVGGYYDGSTVPSYYRVDFRDGSGYLPLLRNHVYNVLVRSVTGPGYPNPDDAFHGTPRLVAEIVDWNAVNEHTIFDGQYFLEVDRDSIGLNGSGDAQTFTAKTNYDITDQGFLAGLWLTKSSGASWLTVTGGADGQPLREFTLTAARNTTRRERRAELDLTAGNLTKKIVVTQAPFIQVANYLTVSPTRATFAGELPYSVAPLAVPDDESTTITVSSDGEWTAKISGYSYYHDKFELSVGSGDASITGTGYSTLVSGTGNVTIIVKPIGDNATVHRRYYFNLSFTATDVKNVPSQTVRISQEPALPAGVLAAPGIIGYIWNPGGERHRELTINGSKEYNYNGSPLISGGVSRATGEPVEPYTVYIALFKYGSLVALLGQETPGTGFVPSTATVAWPEEWMEDHDALDSLFDGKADGAESWALVPTIPSGVLEEDDDFFSYTNTLPNKGADEALGDPCVYYAGKGLWADDWHTPSTKNNAWDAYGTASFGNQVSSGSTDYGGAGRGVEWRSIKTTSTGYGADYVKLTDGLPQRGATGGDGAGGQRWEMFLTENGAMHHSNGEYNPPASLLGDYRSSTSLGDNSGASYLTFYGGYGVGASGMDQKTLWLNGAPHIARQNGTGHGNYHAGVAVRCVRYPAATKLDAPDELVFEWTGPSNAGIYTLNIPVVSDGVWGYTFDIDPDLPASTFRETGFAPGNQLNDYDGHVSVILYRTYQGAGSSQGDGTNNSGIDREIGTVTIFSIEDPTLFKTVRVHQTPEP